MEIIGSNIPVNIRTLVYTGPGSNVPVNIGYEPAQICLWEDRRGDQVAIPFWQSWQPRRGDQIPITFFCQDTEDPYSYFTDFLETYEGGTLDLDVTTTWKLDVYDGAYSVIDDLLIPPRAIELDFYGGEYSEASLTAYKQFDLNVYEGAEIAPVVVTTTDSFDINVYEGAYLGGGGCESLTGFINIAGSENAAPSTTLNSFRLQNTGSSTSGSIVGTASIDTSTSPFIEFVWSQTLSGSWYDNDDSDASVHFGAFLNRAHTSIASTNVIWYYDSPFQGTSGAINAPWFDLWLPRDTAEKTITPRVSVVDGTTISLASFSKPAGVDLYDGNPVSVRFSRDGGKVRVRIYHNSVLLTDQITTVDWPSTIVPLWWYRNYSRSTSYVDIANTQVCSDGFLTTYPPSDLSIPMDFYDGEYLDVSLSTTTNIVVDQFYSGEYLDAILDTRPMVDLAPLAYDGGYATASLWSQAAMQPNAYDGGYFDFDIATNPAAAILAQAYDGAEASFSLSTAIQLGTLPVYEGASASVNLDTLENYRFYAGAELTVSFATSDTFPGNAYDGAYATADLTTYPSEGMGIFRAYDGAEAVVSFTTLPQVLLYPNTIKDGHSFNYDVLGFMSIDLLQTSCCPIKDTHLRIELNDGPAPDERYDGDKTVFTVDLSTLQRFSMNMYSGEYARTIDPNYFSFNFYSGEEGEVTYLQQPMLNIALCTGNFIPDGDHVNVELIATDSICTDSTLFFDGAEARLDVENNVQFQLPFPDGGYMSFDIVIDDIWLLRAYSGEYVRVSNPEFSPHFYADAESSFVFEEKDIVGYDGAFMEFNITTEYEVEFLELGCLENEFVPTNENGDPDWERFNPVPVELDFFSHSIKARCF